MKPQSPSRFLGASHHLRPWCALVAPYQAPGFELSLANYNRTSPVHAPIPPTTDSLSLSHYRNTIEFA